MRYKFHHVYFMFALKLKHFEECFFLNKHYYCTLHGSAYMLLQVKVLVKRKVVSSCNNYTFRKLKLKTEHTLQLSIQELLHLLLL